jgi:NAD(P)-dependent dehydrogenase (short-subunit alcohol dehydrogenase family)
MGRSDSPADTPLRAGEDRMKLANKVAVITDGNSGIGLATAREFAANGAKVVIFGRDRATLDQAVATLGKDALAVQGDVRRISDLKRLFAQVSGRWGLIDVLVANAGVAKFILWRTTPRPFSTRSATSTSRARSSRWYKPFLISRMALP